MSIQPTYVTFEQAKFIDYPYLTDTGYSNNGNVLIRKNFIPTNGWINRPEQWQVVEWLRVNPGIWIDIRYMDNVAEFGYIITSIPINTEHNEKYYFSSPQEAISAAFDYIRENNLI